MSSLSVRSALCRSDCRFCSSKLTADEALHPSNGVRDVCGQSECQSKSLICCEKTLACGCACNGIKNETECLPCLKHDLKIDEDEYCGVSPAREGWDSERSQPATLLLF